MRNAVQNPSPVITTPKTTEIEIECDRPPVESKHPAEMAGHDPRQKAGKKTSKIKAPTNANFFDWRTLNWSMTFSSKPRH